MIESIWALVEPHQHVLWALGAASIAMLVLSALVIPVVIIRLPSDFYSRHEHRDDRFLPAHPVLRIVILLLKNAIALVLLLAGVAMLVLPGQGILTILAGLALADFPGKRVLELRIMRSPAILNSANWIRRRAGREPLTVKSSG